MSSEVIISCLADEAPPQTVQRNFRLGVMNGVFFIIGEALLDPTLVLVAFVSQLSPMALFVGLVLPLRDSLWAIPQLWMSGFVQSLPQKIVLCRRVTVVRMISWVFMVLEINLIRDPHTLLVAFFITFGISSFASGVNGLAFMEVVSKTIPSRRRGEFFAWRLGISGAINIGSSLLVRWLLSPQSPLSFPHNFGLLSFLYLIFASAGLISFNMIDEPADENVLPVQPMHVLLKRALEFLKTDTIYRNFMILLSVMEVAAMATPFFAVFVQQVLGGDPSMVGIYLGITIASNLGSNLIFGRVSIRTGNRQVMLLSVLSGTIMSASVLLLVLLAEPLKISAAAASIWLIPVFIFAGIRSTGYTISSNSILLDISPINDRSLYVGFLNTLTGLILLATGFSGLLKDWLGMKILIVITLAAHLLALYLTMIIRVKRNAS
ncbi:MAG: MFS transporter [Anaerolineae bacterium]|nr:MFS transporter [Anaerolineae bacterium]